MMFDIETAKSLRTYVEEIVSVNAGRPALI